MKAAALADLYVEAQFGIVVTLHAVDAQVGRAVGGAAGQHKGEGEEGAAVVGPTGDEGQIGEARGAAQMGEDGGRTRAALADTHRLKGEAARAPELAGGRRDEFAGQAHGVFDEADGPRAEGQVDAAGRAEQIGDDGERAALDLSEEEGGSVGGDDAAVDFGQFLIGIDRGGDLDEFPLAAEQVDELTEVAQGSGHPPSIAWRGPESNCGVRPSRAAGEDRRRRARREGRPIDGGR
ncbi:MAG: hypothetical protein BWZ08_02539 [candidate division BRC1 bacterium ADurb.BinA292]|nr:MAG: hypothetical protein BWZ08_02539 [candidate division BRC1 bacterium ADurb.BinA292]